MSTIHSLTLQANAKINLTLDILGTRPDGFHEVEMLMQSIALHDVVSLEKIPSGIYLTIEGAELAADATNLAYRAAELFFERLQIEGGVKIHLEKHIPLAAGLAGGSADAAAVLYGLFKLYAKEVDVEMRGKQGVLTGDMSFELSSMGATLGSDIPFCLAGGTMLATGRGEVLKRLRSLPPLFVVLAKPPVSVSTAWAYRAYDEATEIVHPDTNAMLRAIECGNVASILDGLSNVLEGVTIKAHPELLGIKQTMKEHGVTSLMSGSGPTIYGLTADGTRARALFAALQERENKNREKLEVFLTELSDQGIRDIV